MKLFVGNLPYAATEADITDFFTQAGVTVDSVNVMRDRFTGEARGFGFVEINDDGAANRRGVEVGYPCRADVEGACLQRCDSLFGFAVKLLLLVA